jgi:hypothetical protein
MLEDMDLKTLMSVLYDYMNTSYDDYSDAELSEEVKQYYPELLVSDKDEEPDHEPDESTGWN